MVTVPKLKISFRKMGQRIRKVRAKTWLSIFTFVFIIVFLVAARQQLAEAWHLLGKVNIFILLLLIPLQFGSYYANSEMFLTYLRSRGQLKHTNGLQATSMALELNFVNHIFPSGGVSGVSYMVWRLGKLGVSAGQATMAQLMRYIVQFGTFSVLLVLALIVATIENQASNWVVVMVAVVITMLVFLVMFGSYLIGSESRMVSFSRWITRSINKIVAFITFGKVKDTLKKEKTQKFFVEFHADFMALRKEKRLLTKPIMWSFTFNIFEILLFTISFWALGASFSPAVLLIAYGAATLAAVAVLTPGGAGAYEAIMVGVLTAGGMDGGAALAGVVLTRATLIACTLLSGLVVYQRALRIYGQPKIKKNVNLSKLREDSSNNG